MPILQVDSLRKSFAGVEAVRGISFTVKQGCCVSLLGPNGAGKTTTLKMLAGLIRPTAGTIQIEGAAGQDVRPFIGYLPQQPAFHEWMTGAQFLEYVARLAGVSRSDTRVRVRDMLALVGLHEAANRRVGGYSGGMKQRLGIAQALIHRPKLVMMDEPLSALDPVGRHEVLRLMDKIRHETTILYSTHVLHDAEEVSDDILILVRGELAVSGSLHEVRESHRQPVIRLQSEVSLEPWHDEFRRLPGVSQVEGDHNEAAFHVSDVAETRDALFRFIAEHSLPIERLECGQTSLEDLFLQVVKE